MVAKNTANLSRPTILCVLELIAMKLVSLILAINLGFAYDRINMKFFLKVIKAVEDCQSTILKNNPDFKNSAIKIPTLHITLFAMHLKDINQIEV